MIQRRLTSTIGAVALLTGSVLSSAPAFAAGCPISGKTVLYSGVNCMRGTCANISQKITVLGDKVLLYYDRLDPRGLVFYLGREIDPNSGGLNESYQYRAPNGLQGSREVSTAIASYDGTNLALRVHRQFIRSNGEVFLT